jgi:exodeoxyribonuclease VII large subunit
VERKRAQFEALGPKLSPNALRAELRHSRSELAPLAARLLSSIGQSLTERRAALVQSGKLLVSLSYRSVLARGYAVVKDGEGQLVHARAGLAPGDAVSIEFADGAADAIVTGGPPLRRRSRGNGDLESQQDLF